MTFDNNTLQTNLKKRKAIFSLPKDSKKLKTNNDDDYFKQNEITITPPEALKERFTTFSRQYFESFINKRLVKQSITIPTPIQSIGLPIVLEGKDFIGVAETGSGKTLCFMLPGIMHILKNSVENEQKVPKMIVLAPTRELAKQIHKETKKIIKKHLSSVCIYGGASKHTQIEKIQQGRDIIIATPGRLMDLLLNDEVDSSMVSYLVFDEADRMLDMGFEPQMRQIMKYIPKKRQTLMFSATWPREVKILAEKYLTDPIKVNIGSQELSANKNIEQKIVVVNHKEKERELFKLLKQLKGRKILLFALYKKSVAYLERTLKSSGYNKISVMHGNKNQNQRERALSDFIEGRNNILVATDVAGRGIDVDDIEYVINYEFPLQCEDYIHRIGRTGRAGKKGIAYTFFTQDNKEHSRELVDILKDSNQSISKELQQMADSTYTKPKRNSVSKKYGGNYRLFTKKKRTHIKF